MSVWSKWAKRVSVSIGNRVDHSPQTIAVSTDTRRFMLQRSPQPSAVPTDTPWFMLQPIPQPSAVSLTHTGSCYSPQHSTIPTDTLHTYFSNCPPLILPIKCLPLCFAPDTSTPLSGRPYCQTQLVNVSWKYVIHMDDIITAVYVYVRGRGNSKQ